MILTRMFFMGQMRKVVDPWIDARMMMIVIRTLVKDNRLAQKCHIKSWGDSGVNLYYVLKKEF
jgi:hypothetical protein